jgi:hypothetical protein
VAEHHHRQLLEHADAIWANTVDDHLCRQSTKGHRAVLREEWRRADAAQ